MPIPIEEHLRLSAEGVHTLGELESWKELHKRYPLSEIRGFYEANSHSLVDFGPQKRTTTEILYACGSFVEAIDDNFFAIIASNWFVLKNGLLSHFRESGLGLHAYLQSLGPLFIPRYLIEGTPRVAKLVNQGKLLLPMTSCDSKEVKLTNRTFGDLIHREIDALSIAACTGLSIDEVRMLAQKVAGDQAFMASCRKLITDQGIQNDTMLLLAALCGLKPDSGSRISSAAHGYFCRAHFKDIYMPYYTFAPVLELTQLEVYFLYLHHKPDVSDDLEDISEALRTYDDSEPDGLARNTTVEGDLLSKDISIQASILDLVLSRNHILRYEADVYRYLAELPDKPYFALICRKHAKELIEDEVFDVLPGALEDVSAVLEYLASRRDKGRDADQDSCSFDTLDSTFLMTSVGPAPSELEPREIKAPLICFREHEWLTEHEKNILMEGYIEELDLGDIVENYLNTKKPSEAVNCYFKENLTRVSDKVHRASICCKLDIPVDVKGLTDAEIKSVIDLPGSAFQLRKVVYTKKISRLHIKKFMRRLTLEQMDVVIGELEHEPVSLQFIDAFLGHAAEKYDFLHVSGLLVTFLSSKVVPVVKMVQQYLIDLLKGLFVQESYLDQMGVLYSMMLGFTDRQIRCNNDKILVLIGKAFKAMEKDVFIGNLKPTTYT